MKDAVLLAPRALLELLRQDLLLLVLVLVCAGLTLWHTDAVATYPQLVDWPTIASLAGLILLTTGLEESGFLQHAAYHVITRMHTERHLAFLLVGASATLATVLTNDIALLVVVPLTWACTAWRRCPRLGW
jgi:di/tricarboxylate transporter